MSRVVSLRPLIVVAALTAAALACERAEVPITPATPLVNTPVLLPSDTPTASVTPTPPASSTATLDATQLAALDTDTASPIPPTPTDTLTPSPTATQPTSTPTPIPPTATRVIRTATPTGRAGAATPTRSGVKPTATPTPAPGSIPANATFTQKFTVRPIGGRLLNSPKYIADGQTATWASLRDGAGNEYWSLEFSQPEKIVGIRLKAYADGVDQTELQTIEISGDSKTWLTIYTGQSTCAELPCDVLPAGEFVDHSWPAITAQFVRIRGGITRFAFSEVLVAIMP